MSVENIVDNKFARLFEVYGKPILFGLISSLFWIVLSDMRAAMASNNNDIQTLKGDVREIKTTMDTGLIWRINEIERRLNQVDAAQKTP